MRIALIWSPKTLIAATVANNIIPGKNVIQYAPERIKSKPFEINEPSEGSVMGTPTPRKLSVASIEIECAAVSYTHLTLPTKA